MSEKRLFQVSWENGQTDGDDVGGTVRRILNMDLDSLGMITTRNALKLSSEFSGFEIGNVAHSPYSPSWSSASSWVAGVCATSVVMIPVVGQQVMWDDHVSLNVPGIGDNELDISASRIVSYGDKFFLCAILSTGDNFGVFMISSPENDSRFRATTLTRGTTYDDEQTNETEAWGITSIENDRPKVITQPVTGFAFLDDDNPGMHGDPLSTSALAGAGMYHWATAKAQLNGAYHAGINSVISRLGSSSDAVGLVVAMVSPDDDIDYVHGAPPYPSTLPGHGDIEPNEGMFGRGAVVAFKVQFIYYGGGMSLLSEESLVSGWNEFPIADSDDEVTTYALGIAPIVSSNLNRAVKGINIYRKIISSGNSELAPDSQFMLVRTVWLDSKVLEDGETRQGETNIEHTLWASNGRRFGYFDEEYGLSNPVSSYMWYLGLSRLSIPAEWTPTGDNRKVKCDDGDTYLTSGWVKVGSSHMMYLDNHYESECQYSFSEDVYVPGNMPTYSWQPTSYSVLGRVELRFTAKVFSNIYGRGNSLRTLIRAGARLPSASLQNNSGDVFYRMYQPMNFAYRTIRNYAFPEHDYGSPGDKVALMSAADDGEITYSGTGVAGLVVPGEDSIPFVAFRDVGETVLDDELSIMGGSDSEFIVVKPDNVAVVGGRLCGVSGRHDGESKPSRFSYSQFQNYGMTLQSSYLDYGARSDGEAKAISTHRGMVLIHFSGATYVVDVSGGSDMAWRELGANSGIGIINKFAVAETPAGCVWGDHNGVYMFDGQQIAEVTVQPQRGISVKETYLTMIQSNTERVRVNYRPDKKQVWISNGSDVLVFDITTGAWHEHSLDELASLVDFDVIDIWDLSGKIYVVVRRIDGLVGAYELSTEDSDHDFSWGVDIKFSAQVPELIKKAKRFYVDTMAKSAGHRINTMVHGRGAVAIVQDLLVTQVDSFFDPDHETMIRFSASARGRSLSLVVRNTAGDKWAGAFGSLGMSHKFKSLK